MLLPYQHNLSFTYVGQELTDFQFKTSLLLLPVYKHENIAKT